MNSMENSYTFENTSINQQNLSESRLHNGILMQMATQLHIGLCMINGAIENLASTVSNVSNSIDKQTEALRKRKYVLVDKFYNVYDEIVKMKYDEEKKCFMMFGKNHSWKIFITSDMDEYNFERLNTKLSYSELYDMVITLDYLVNTFGVEYSMDLFNSKISTDALKKLDELLEESKKESKKLHSDLDHLINAYGLENTKDLFVSKVNADGLKKLDKLLEESKKLDSDKTSKLSDYIKESCVSIDNMNKEISETLHYKRSIGECAIIILLVYIACALAIVLGVCLNAQVAWILGLVIGIIFFPMVGMWIWNYYRYKKQGHDVLTIKQLSEKENKLKKELEVLKSNVANEILSILCESDLKIKKVDSEIKKFVDSFRK